MQISKGNWSLDRQSFNIYVSELKIAVISMLVNELKESSLKALLGSGFNSEAETFVVSSILSQFFGCLVVHDGSVLFSREGVLEGRTEILNSQIF